MASSREPEDKKDDDGYGIGEGLGLERPAGSVLPPPESSDASNAPSPIPPPARPAKVSVVGGSKGGSAAGSASSAAILEREEKKIARILLLDAKNTEDKKLIDLIHEKLNKGLQNIDTLTARLGNPEELDAAFDTLFPSLASANEKALLLHKREVENQKAKEEKQKEFSKQHYDAIKDAYKHPTREQADEFTKFNEFYFLHQPTVPEWIKQKRLIAWLLTDVSLFKDKKMEPYFKREAFLERLVWAKGSKSYTKAGSSDKESYGKFGQHFVLSFFMSGQEEKDFPGLKSLSPELQVAIQDNRLKEKLFDNKTQKYSDEGELLAKLAPEMTTCKRGLYQYLQSDRLKQEAKRDRVFKSMFNQTHKLLDQVMQIQWAHYAKHINEKVKEGKKAALIDLKDARLKGNVAFMLSFALPAWMKTDDLINALIYAPEYFKQPEVLKRVFGENSEHTEKAYQEIIKKIAEVTVVAEGVSRAEAEQQAPEKLKSDWPVLHNLIELERAKKAKKDEEAEVKRAEKTTKLQKAFEKLSNLLSTAQSRGEVIKAKREKELEEKKAAENAKKLAAEQKRLAEEKLVAEEKLRAEERRIEEEKRRAEEALRLAEEKRQVDARNKLMAEMQERAERERQEREQKEKIERDRQAVEDLKQADIKAQAVVSRYFDNLEKTSAVSAAAHHQVLSFATLFKTVTARDAKIIADRKEVSLPVAVRRQVVSLDEKKLDEKEVKGAEFKESKRTVRDDYVTTIKRVMENPTLVADTKGARIRAGQAAVNWVNEKADAKDAKDVKATPPVFDAKTAGCYVEGVHRVNDRDRYQISVQRMPPSLDRTTIATNVLRAELKNPAFECKAEIWNELKLPYGVSLEKDLPAIEAVLQKMGGIEAKQQAVIARTISNAFNDAWISAVDAKNGIYIPSESYLRFANMQDNTFNTEMGVNRMCYVRPNEDVLMVRSYILIRAAKNLPYTNESKYKYKPSEQEIEAVRDLLKQGKLLNAMPAELKTQVDALKEAAKNVSGASHKEITDYIEQMSAGINLTEKDRDRVTDLMSSITSRLRPS